MNGNGPMYAIGAALLAMVGAIVFWLIPAANRGAAEWRAWCEAQGGHVIDNTETTTSVVVGTNGEPGVAVGSHTTYYCLSVDGRILGIR